MAKAGYDPRAALEFWKRMEASGDREPVEFLSSHPSHGTREAQLAQWTPEAQSYFARTTPVSVMPLQ